ncbi:N-acetylmuramic acid 6-phosphate etherase [Nesterenkonia sandarakina]|uniref:N-acetylmuramic acid 6-phosphate etherase n=1 Tax=Nesterenkonia sandarakina TaxID=272918 RepID=A0A7Z0EAM2_9MICC|nr:N-acetylmuramic acid 6-phosphate etherase [Nesterenkonia sandarakina]NYJ18028.1 N-acetylmuramic acid 6-phosphate etherase [Nesterenkonia sandarakina]
MSPSVESASSALPPTERRNPRSMNLDDLNTLEVLQLLNTEDRVAVDAVAAVLPELAPVVHEAARRLRRGGTVHYFGAGTSGRLGVLDASELMPTYNLEPGRVVGHIAGGPQALVEAVENAEDSVESGRADASALSSDDLAIGIASSGNTPYVAGALESARGAGAYTVLISSNPEARVAAHADQHLLLNTGPEVVTGSTRMKAGTAQKLVLNGFSTALMIELGRTWQNLMVSVVATNAKLRERTTRILCDAADLDAYEASALLERTGGDLKVGILAALGEVSVQEAIELLEEHAGSVREALRDPRSTARRP